MTALYMMGTTDEREVNRVADPGSLEWWRRLTRQVCVGSEEEIEAVAVRAHETGKGIYHSAWEVFTRDRGGKHLCSCTPCVEERKAVQP